MRGWPPAGDLVAFRAPYNLHVHAVPQVFHRFAEHGVVHQLVEVGLEVAFRLLPELLVHPDVRLHPGLSSNSIALCPFFRRMPRLKFL